MMKFGDLILLTSNHAGYFHCYDVPITHNECCQLFFGRELLGLYVCTMHYVSNGQEIVVFAHGKFMYTLLKNLNIKVIE